MSGFIVAGITSESDASYHERLETAVSAFRKKGMRLTHRAVHDGFVIYLFGNQSHDPAQVQTTDPRGQFCTYVGTLLYRGRTGSDATAAILDDLRRGQPDCIDSAIGNFCLLIKDDRGLRIAADRAGLHHIYHDDTLSFVSNSFLATACASPHRTLEVQELCEYVQLGATFGSRSLVREVQLLEPECEVQMEGRCSRIIRKSSVWDANAARWRSATLEDRIANAIEIGNKYYEQVAQTFTSKVTAALSGGYDSRLSLAFMLHHHIAPSLFVYGAAHDSDVEVAKSICQAEGLELEHIDHNANPPLEPEEYWQNQEAVFHGLDGLTQYGFACDPHEVSHRRKRVAGGLLAVNGGGGEIWRDFWKLPDKPMSAEKFVRAYFGGRVGGLVHDEHAENQLFQRLAEKIREIADSGDEPMATAVVQSLYARFRLRFWQGKNNSVDNHVGYAVTPFSEHHFSVPAMWIPMEAKRDGWFERQLIRRVSPRLASYPSSYGYDFVQGPGVSSRMRTRVTYRLPTWLRTLRRSSDKHYRRPYYQANRFVRIRFGAGPLEVEKYFCLSQLRDSLAFSRALTIERLLRGEWT